MGEGQAWADTGLTLGLSLRIGGGCESIKPVDGSDGGTKRKKPFPAAIKFHELFPPIHPKQEEEDEHEVSYRDDGSSSTRSVGDAAKRSDHQEEYKDDSADDVTNRRGAVRTSPIRKKLRLSKEQSTMLEDSFRKHPTLHPTQKLELAEKLNLQPRQVEVWFQNRRARTKLKQTEVDLELLRRCCAALRDENTRLMGELHELRSAMAINGNPRPSTGNSAPRPQKMAAVSCTSCMTAVESIPSGSGSVAARGGGVTHGGAATVATAAVRPLGLYRCRRAIKEGQIDRLRD